MLGFVDQDGVERRERLEDCAAQPFESGAAVRTFPSYRGQRNWPGLWWSATLGRHVGYESWLERDHAMLLDFDTRVVGFAPQPFWLFYRDGDRVRSHAPDYFARQRDGTATVLDCRPDDRIEPRDEAAFEATARACEQVGWQYRRRGAIEQPLLGNLAWLAGYRHARFAGAGWAELLESVFAVGRPLLDGVEIIGSRVAVLPALFHLLWRQQLRADLSVPLSEASLVWTAAPSGCAS